MIKKRLGHAIWASLFLKVVDMNKKRRKQKRSCGMKVAHDTRELAMIAIHKTLERHFIFHKLSAYHCKHCGKWHVGKSNIIMYKRFKELCT